MTLNGIIIHSFTAFINVILHIHGICVREFYTKRLGLMKMKIQREHKIHLYRIWWINMIKKMIAMQWRLNIIERNKFGLVDIIESDVWSVQPQMSIVCIWNVRIFLPWLDVPASLSSSHYLSINVLSLLIWLLILLVLKINFENSQLNFSFWDRKPIPAREQNKTKQNAHKINPILVRKHLLRNKIW